MLGNFYIQLPLGLQICVTNKTDTKTVKQTDLVNRKVNSNRYKVHLRDTVPHHNTLCVCVCGGGGGEQNSPPLLSSTCDNGGQNYITTRSLLALKTVNYSELLLLIYM